MNALADRDFCAALVLSLGHFLWQGTLIAALSALVTRHVRGSQTRYNILLGALALMAVSPLATLAIGNLRFEQRVAPATVTGIPRYKASAPQFIPVGETLPSHLPSALPRETEPVITAESSLTTPVIPTRDSPWHRFLPWLVNFYLAGVAMMLLRLTVGLWGGWKLRRRSSPVAETALLQALRRQSNSLGLRFLPLLAFCDQVAIPTVIGVLRPTILLPLSLTSGLTPEQIETILAHELAHVRRYDHLVNLLQRLVESVLFFHPAVWWLSNQIRVERELCCDDLVLACGAQPLDYAQSLLRVAELSRMSKLNRSVSAVSLLATGQPSKLRQRIARLLGDATETPVRLQHRWPALLLGMICLVIAWKTTDIGWTVTENQSLAAEQRVAKPKAADQTPTEVKGQEKKAVERAVKTSAADPSPVVTLPPEALPPGATQRFGTSRFRVPGPFKRVSFTADDRSILVERNSYFTVLDRETGLAIKNPRYEFGPGWISTLGVSDDRKLVAVMLTDDTSKGGKSATQVVVTKDGSSEKIVFPWDDDRGQKRSLVFSPDNKTLAGISEATGLKLWNLESRAVIPTPEWANKYVRALAFSPDGQTIAVVGQQTMFWKWRTDEEPQLLQRDLSRMNCAVKYSPDGKWLLTGYTDHLANPSGIAVLDAATLEFTWYIPIGLNRIYDNESILLSHDSRFAIIGLEKSKRAEVWDLTTRQRVHSFDCPGFRSASLSRDGKLLAIGRFDCLIELRDMATGKPAVMIPDGHHDVAHALQFTRDGRTLVSGGGNDTVRVWDVVSGKQKRVFEHASGSGFVKDLALSPDGQLAVSAGHDNTLAIWDLATGKARAMLEGHGSFSNARPIQFAPDGSKFVSWGEDLQLRWWNAADGTLLATYPTALAAFVPRERANVTRQNPMAYRPPQSLFSEDAKTLLVLVDGKIYDFDTATGRERRQFAVDGIAGGMFNRIALSPDQHWFVNGRHLSDSNTKQMKRERLATLYDFQSLKVERELKLAGLYSGPVVFSPDSKFLVYHTGVSDRDIEIVSVQSGTVTARIPNVPLCYELQFAPDGKQLAAALEDSTILLWDLSRFSTNAKEGD
ncbi:MAG: blaR1 8 [Planctomycetaceae bacterium]|nr:blaR1 8 [Planctomycetaceae bacterium]